MGHLFCFQCGAERRGRPVGVALFSVDVNVGALVRATEPHFDLVESFDMVTNTCPIILDHADAGMMGMLQLLA